MDKTNLYYLARIKTGKKQFEVAKELNLNKSTISKWENGVSIPDQTILPAVASLYDVSVDYLLGRDIQELFYPATIVKTEIQELFDNMSEEQQELVITYCKGIFAGSASIRRASEYNNLKKYNV